MSDWTRTPQEYEHARQLMLQVPVGNVVVWLKDGSKIEGTVVGQGMGTDVGKNLESTGRPIVTSMWGEIRLLLKDRQIVVISARDIERIENASP